MIRKAPTQIDVWQNRQVCRPTAFVATTLYLNTSFNVFLWARVGRITSAWHMLFWILCWPHKKCCERRADKLSGITTRHAYRVLSVCLYAARPLDFTDGIILCTLHAECGAVSQIVCRSSKPEMSQPADSGDIIHGRRKRRWKRRYLNQK